MSAPRPPAPRRADYRIFRTLQTRWMDNDIYGHMNNAVHYSLFDTAVSGWQVERGLVRLGGGPLRNLVVETGCRYLSEMAFPDLVTAGLRLGHVGRSSVRYEVGLFRNDEDTAAAEGFFVHVQVDATSHRPVPLDAAALAVLAELAVG